MHNILSKEEQDKLAAKVTSAASKLEQLVLAIDRAVSFYLPLHEEKWRKFNNLKNLLQFNASNKETSVPDCYGIVLNTLEFDAAEAREAKIRFMKLARVLHPDRGGSASLFHIAELAYKARDLILLDALLKSVYNNDETALSAVSRRLQAAISQTRAKPAFKLLMLDQAAGKFGLKQDAADFAEKILDNLIESLAYILLTGDNHGHSKETSREQTKSI